MSFEPLHPYSSFNGTGFPFSVLLYACLQLEVKRTLQTQFLYLSPLECAGHNGRCEVRINITRSNGQEAVEELPGLFASA